MRPCQIEDSSTGDGSLCVRRQGRSTGDVAFCLARAIEKLLLPRTPQFRISHFTLNIASGPQQGAYPAAGRFFLPLLPIHVTIPNNNHPITITFGGHHMWNKENFTAVFMSQPFLLRSLTLFDIM